MLASEADWPFRLHVTELARCVEFLARSGPGPRVLRVFGPSGTGKSFLVRELMTRLEVDEKNGLGLYMDVPSGDLEASALLTRLDLLLSIPRKPSRDAPCFVGRKAVRGWVSVKRGTSARRASYAYQAARDLAAQIPVAGPFIKALLPDPGLIVAPADNGTAPLRFLMRRSRTRPVVLSIDNVQFIPFAVRDLLDVELADAGPHLRLVLVERTDAHRPRLDWLPPLSEAELLDLELTNASIDEVTDVVRAVLPGADDLTTIARGVFRRSEGNLKSVWFQLRLIVLRRDDQEALPVNYEDVILTLSPLDQAVLRFVVFTIGGLTLATVVALLQVSELRAQPDAVISAITDLASLGLLVVNGDHSDRVRVEHELVAQVVDEITPEDEKLDLRTQVVGALSAMLESAQALTDEEVLYDRLLGIVNENELRQTPSLLSHVVRFIQIQGERDRHRYLASACRDSVCWDVLDALPDTSLRVLLDAVQKCALFDFGLIAAARLRRSSSLYESLASLYEAKYLVQLFRYEEATFALERVEPSKEKRAVEFNILLGLADDDRASAVAREVFAEVSEATGTEHDYVILRNAIHLFRPNDSLDLVECSVDGFRSLGRRFGVATAENNRGIVELALGSVRSANTSFQAARERFQELDSPEVYQPIVNLSVLALLGGDIVTARRLLATAREVAPRSLLQDDAMFGLNELVLQIIAGVRSELEALERMRVVVEIAERTRDVRFHDVAAWFAESLEAVVVGTKARSGPIASRIEKMRNGGHVPLEVFVPIRFGGAEVEAPVCLSPHWRY